jgi:2-polyprenyl-3-methyl-5-hydroxy-6-metoxy-1,4-benzoquinol methylase
MTPSLTPRCLACQSGRTEFWAQASDAEYRTSDDVFTYHRCLDCQVLFIDPVPRDRLAEIYPPNYYSFAAPKRSLVGGVKDFLDRRLFRRLLRQIPGEKVRVLDVGGGSGGQLDQIRKLDRRVILTQVVDLDRDAIERAARNGHAAFCGPIEEFVTEERFDLILLLNLIEHVWNPGAILAKVRQLLTPGGMVLIKTPNHDSLDARLFRNRNWGGYHCPRHWVLFDRPSFVSLAQRQGLRVREFRYTQGAPFWAQSTLFALARRGWVSITRERPAMYHPLFPLFGAAFALMDFTRAFFGARTSQMFFILGADHALATEGHHERHERHEKKTPTRSVSEASTPLQAQGLHPLG